MPFSEKFCPNNPKALKKAFRKLKITVVSTDADLPRPPGLHLRRMKVYAEVSLAGDSTTAKKTDAVKIEGGGERKTMWNIRPVELTVPQPNNDQTPQNDDVMILKLFCKRSMGCPSEIGVVEYLSVRSLFDKCVSGVCESWTSPNGTFNISYSFGDTFWDVPK